MFRTASAGSLWQVRAQAAQMQVQCGCRRARGRESGRIKEKGPTLFSVLRVDLGGLKAAMRRAFRKQLNELRERDGL